MIAICVHHWIVDLADGPTSMGRCKRCGEKREHKNSVTDPKNWHALDKKRQENDPEYFNRPGTLKTPDGDYLNQ